VLARATFRFGTWEHTVYPCCSDGGNPTSWKKTPVVGLLCDRCDRSQFGDQQNSPVCTLGSSIPKNKRNWWTFLYPWHLQQGILVHLEAWSEDPRGTSGWVLENSQYDADHRRQSFRLDRKEQARRSRGFRCAKRITNPIGRCGDPRGPRCRLQIL